MSINVQPLVQLADLRLKTLAENLGVTTGLPADLQAAVTKIQNERAKEVTEAAAAEILNAVQSADQFQSNLAQQILDLEARKANIETLAAQVKRAKDYGFATQNFLPLLKVIGEPVTVVNKDLTSVPKDWEPTAPAAAEAPVAAA